MHNALRRSVFNRASHRGTAWWPNLRRHQFVEANRPIWGTVPPQSDPVSVAIAPLDTSAFLTQGLPPLTFQAVNLPDGLGIDPNTGIITGTPGTVDVFDPQILATNAQGSDITTFTWTITI